MRDTSAAPGCAHRPPERWGRVLVQGDGHHDGDADGDHPHSPRAHRILLQHLHCPRTRVDQTGE